MIKWIVTWSNCSWMIRWFHLAKFHSFLISPVGCKNKTKWNILVRWIFTSDESFESSIDELIPSLDLNLYSIKNIRNSQKDMLKRYFNSRVDISTTTATTNPQKKSQQYHKFKIMPFIVSFSLFPFPSFFEILYFCLWQRCVYHLRNRIFKVEIVIISYCDDEYKSIL